MKSSDQEIREDANNKFNKILLRYKKVAQYEINSILDTKKIEDDLRGFKYPEEYNYVHNDIPKKFVDLLVHQVENRNDISERYYQLKAELMGKKKLEYYERNVPYGKISKKYKFEEAYDIVSKAYKNLDEDFYNIFVNLFDTGSVDVYPGIGKRLGAYCAPHSVSTPLYLLLNFSGNVDDIMTIAHECGHAVNFEMMKQIKNPFYYGVSSIALEVASTFFEDFACDELEKTLSDEERLGLLMERLNSSVSTIQRQIACFKFEQDLHRDFRQNKYVSSDNIGKLFQFRMKEYMGDFVDDPDYSKNWWVYWSHIRHFFYVYSYACGELISKYFRKQVKEDKKWINNFKDFLKAGTADSPINTFRKVGVDISSADIWNSGLDEMEEQLNTAEKLARKLGKI
jgi:oligoendopeptidase F